jgi:type IV secretion system protein VirB11
MTTINFRSEAFARGARMLRTALGPAIAGYLEDPSIVEVMLNPDGRLWIDRLSGGLEDTGCRVTPADAERIVRLVAHHVGVEVHAGSPRVSAELPETGERFEGFHAWRLRRGRHHVGTPSRTAARGRPRP